MASKANSTDCQFVTIFSSRAARLVRREGLQHQSKFSFLLFSVACFLFLLLPIGVSVMGQKTACRVFPSTTTSSSFSYACRLRACQINLPVCEPKSIGKGRKSSTNAMFVERWVRLFALRSIVTVSDDYASFFRRLFLLMSHANTYWPDGSRIAHR